MLNLILGFVWHTVVFREPYLKGLGKTAEQLAQGPSLAVASSMQLLGNLATVLLVGWLISLCTGHLLPGRTPVAHELIHDTLRKQRTNYKTAAGYTRPSGEKADDFRGILTMVMVKQDGKWLIRALQNTSLRCSSSLKTASEFAQPGGDGVEGVRRQVPVIPSDGRE